MSEIYKIIPRDDIEGWFDWSKLYTEMIVRASNGSHFIEVGSWMGKSACYMAESIRESGKQIRFDCIDIWDDQSTEIAYSAMIQNGKAMQLTLQDMFKNNLDRYGVLGLVNAIKDSSIQASKGYVDNTIDMIFIDASHDYTFVKADLESWYPKLRPGGEFAGHDYFYSPDGVQKAIKEFCNNNNLKFEVIGECWYLKKP